MLYLDVCKTFVKFVTDSMRSARLAQKTYDELSKLDDRELSELGLSRADIPYVAFQNIK